MNEAGKGSEYRKVDPKKFRESMDRVFGKKCPKCGEVMDLLGGSLVCVKCKGQ